MEWHERLARIRQHGPRRSILRHMLEWLASKDTREGSFVYAGKMAQETGIHPRTIRRELGNLVRLGWLAPEKAPGSLSTRTATWTHGHTGGCRVGGQGEKTRYAVIYRDTPAVEPPRAGGRKTKQVGPGDRQQVGPGDRKQGGESPPSTTPQVGPGDREVGPGDHTTRSPGPPIQDHTSKIIQDGGTGSPPSPQNGVDTDAVSTQAAVAAVARAPLARGMHDALRASGAAVSTGPALAAWEAVMREVGGATEREVARVVYDLTTAYGEAHHAKPDRPFNHLDLAPYVAVARSKLAARRLLSARLQPRSSESAA